MVSAAVTTQVQDTLEVAELLPGAGYFTRLFSKAVGPRGRVYALVPAPSPNAPADAPDFAARVKAIAVPGSQIVAHQCEQEGIAQVFRDAGFEWRAAGCSMCLAMNPDKLVGDQLCASSSNRNFKGRQGSPTGRTVLMSPVMVAAAAIAGHITDARVLFHLEQPAAVA